MHPDVGGTEDEPPALWSAVAEGRLDIAELLASHGADVNFYTCSGKFRFDGTILLAVASCDSDMILMLARYGADVHSEHHFGLYSGTPLHFAVLYSRLGAVQTLLHMGVPLDCEDCEHRTPLEAAAIIAVQNTDTEEVWNLMVQIGKLLVEAGATVPYTEAGLRPLRDRPGQEKTVKFQMEMIAAMQQRARDGEVGGR